MMEKTVVFFVFVLIGSHASFAQSVLKQVQNQVEKTMNDTAIVPIGSGPMEAPPITENKWNQIHSKYFNLNIGLAILLDHNIVEQDYNSIEQVGKVGAATQFRADRLVFSGDLPFFKYPWRYMISVNFNGLDGSDATNSFTLNDLSLEIPFGKTGGWITIGKQKEGVGLEYVMPGTQGQFMERGSGAPIFVRQRNVGIRYSNSILHNRMTFTAGFFNNWIETGNSFSANGSQVVARVTGLAQYESDHKLVHLGLAYRYTQPNTGVLSYKGKPEVNTAPFYVSTGNFEASGANTLMGELIVVKGPVSVTAEYMNALVNSSFAGNPSFTYFQAGGSWFMTGENRRYNKQTGNQGKLIPAKNFKFKKGSGPGAFEFGARYTQSDLSDKGISGGKFGRLTGALSWYPNAHFRFEINYGHGVLDNMGLNGVSNFYQFRIQFEI